METYQIVPQSASQNVINTFNDMGVVLTVDENTKDSVAVKLCLKGYSLKYHYLLEVICNEILDTWRS